MLCQFSVKNFMCFRDEITLDMQATPISEHEEHLLIDKDGESFLPIAVIYGPNGGGKSSLLRAVHSLHQKIMAPVYASRNEKEAYMSKTHNSAGFSGIQIMPFAFSEETLDAPTEYEMYFRTTSAEFVYRSKIHKRNVILEHLARKKIGGSKFMGLFHRDGHSITLWNQFKRLATAGLSDDLPLLSFLIILYSENAIIRDIFRWFDDKILFRNYGNPISEMRVSLSDDESRKKMILDMFKEMDIGISDYRVERLDEQRLTVLAVHEVDGKTFELRLVNESSGTIKLFYLLPDIINSIVEGATLIIDELDAKLHPILLKYIIRLYTSPEINKKKAQLIFTSHDLATLNGEFFRRDEVWFVSKNRQETANLYSLVNFKYTGENYSEEYLMGKFGADLYLRRFVEWGNAK